MAKEKIVIQSYNPYQAICPVTRVVSRETLHLIKMFRAKGFEVSIEPEDGTKLCYFTKKGLRDVFSDPIFLFLAGIPLSIILNLISSWLYDNLKVKKSVERELIPIVIEVDDNGQLTKYAHDGQPISNDKLLEMLIKMEQDKNRFANPLINIGPNSGRPFPVYLEHTNQIIGWAKKTAKDSKGLMVEGIKITDDLAWERIQKGELQGLSVAGVITSSECSICKNEYTSCNHHSPNTYHKKRVAIRIKSMCIAEISIVKEPIQQLANLHLTH